MGNKLYVGNLPYSVRDSDLEQAFGQFGSVTSAKVMMERDTGRSKGFGFVEMGSDAEAQAAIQGMNGQPLGGRGIVVNEARPWSPVRPAVAVGLVAVAAVGTVAEAAVVVEAAMAAVAVATEVAVKAAAVAMEVVAEVMVAATVAAVAVKAAFAAPMARVHAMAAAAVAAAAAVVATVAATATEPLTYRFS
jgi:RNA-binding proteins (RRM domain)